MGVMDEQTKQIMLHMQINNICSLVNGKYQHTSVVHSNGTREERIVISYPHTDAAGSDSSDT